MAKLNTPARNAPTHLRSTPVTHEGGPAKRISPIQELRRTVMACMLWEDNFYENGVSVAERIKALVPKCNAAEVAKLAVEVRTQYKLRHAPLLLVREMVRNKSPYVKETLEQVIQRPDEMGEFLAIYWQDGKTPIAATVKKSLAKAFTKFDPYQLSKWNRPAAVSLQDVMKMVHPKAKDEAQNAAFKQLLEGTLAPPDTWESAHAAGKDKKETFTRLLQEGKLGYLALLRNMRNFVQLGVDEALVKEALLRGAGRNKILPFRFVAAAKYAPRYEATLDKAMQECLANMDKLPGKTALLVDVSYSMMDLVSSRSEITRLDAGAALVAMVAGIAEEYRAFTFSYNTKELPNRKGMALIDAVNNTEHGGTYLGEAIKYVNNNYDYDRLMVFTDEQTADRVPNPKGRGYMVNVSNYKRGVGYGKWVHIDGFSEAVVNFIQELENSAE